MFGPRKPSEDAELNAALESNQERVDNYGRHPEAKERHYEDAADAQATKAILEKGIPNNRASYH